MVHFLNYTLRPIEESDLEIILTWRNTDRIRMNMYTDHVITMEEHVAWYKRLQEEGKNISLVFEYKNEPIGVMNFSGIDQQNNKCTWGFYLGEENLPKGTGFILGYMGLRYAFELLNVRKISGEVFDFNIASYNFHKKLKFIEEGRLVQHIFKQNQYQDIILFAQFQENWKKNKGILEKEIYNKIEGNRD